MGEERDRVDRVKRGGRGERGEGRWKKDNKRRRNKSREEVASGVRRKNRNGKSTKQRGMEEWES